MYLRSVHRFRRPDLVLATSPVMAAHFARCFDIPLERCPVLAYPRLDPFVAEEFRRLCLSFGDYDALQELCAGRTTYLYTPTLRDDDADLLGEALPDLAALSAALEPTNGVLLLKLHPFSAAGRASRRQARRDPHVVLGVGDATCVVGQRGDRRFRGRLARLARRVTSAFVGAPANRRYGKRDQLCSRSERHCR